MGCLIFCGFMFFISPYLLKKYLTSWKFTLSSTKSEFYSQANFKNTTWYFPLMLIMHIIIWRSQRIPIAKTFCFIQPLIIALLSSYHSCGHPMELMFHLTQVRDIILIKSSHPPKESLNPIRLRKHNLCSHWIALNFKKMF